jgi:O-antigen ligase
MGKKAAEWIWPIYVFVYPLFFVPWSNNSWELSRDGRVFWSVGICVVACIALWLQFPKTQLLDIKQLPRFLWKHKILIWVLGFMGWLLVATLLTPVPIHSLLGLFGDDARGALHLCIWGLVFVLVYIQGLYIPNLVRRIVQAGILAGVVMGCAATAEILLGKTLFYGSAAVGTLPVATFPQRGHLAGFFVLVLPMMLVIKGYSKYLAMGITGLALGLTFTRAAVLAVGASTAYWALHTPWKKSLQAIGIIGIAVLAGQAWIQFYVPASQRDLGSPQTLEIRVLMAKAALKGIQDRPVFGWGATYFEQVWPQYLSRGDLELYLQKEFGIAKLQRHIQTPGANPTFLVKMPDGESTMRSVSLWRAHNQFLEIALQAGLVGLVLYLAILLGVVPGAVRLQPAAMGVLAYHGFLLFWHLPFHAAGLLWALMACAALEAYWQANAEAA